MLRMLKWICLFSFFTSGVTFANWNDTLTQYLLAGGKLVGSNHTGFSLESPEDSPLQFSFQLKPAGHQEGIEAVSVEPVFAFLEVIHTLCLDENFSEQVLESIDTAVNGVGRYFEARAEKGKIVIIRKWPGELYRRIEEKRTEGNSFTEALY